MPESYQKLEQLLSREAKLKRQIREQKSRLSKQERKERTRKLIQIGGLAVIAGIDNWDNGILLGALYEIAELNNEPGKTEAWKQHGDAILKEREEKRKGDKNKKCIVQQL